MTALLRTISCLFIPALAVSAAMASGQTAPLPLPDETLESYAVCLANLNNVHKLDVARIDPTPVTREDGSVIRHMLITDGVIETGAEAASYKAEYGTTVTARDAAAGQLKHQYSYERVELNCAGPKLTGVSYQGYSQPLFEPLPVDATP